MTEKHIQGITELKQKKLVLKRLIHVFPIPNPPPSSLPIPSLWVVPVHQPQASSIMLEIMRKGPTEKSVLPEKT